MRLSYQEAVDRYGTIVSGAWAAESTWCVLYQVPEAIAKSWINSATGKATPHIYCNRDMVGPLDQALSLVEARGLITELKTFDGCFKIREVRGDSGKLSTHSYACAIDINAETNKLGTHGDLTVELARCFTDSGFTWGLRFTRQDPMHMSYAWE